MPFQFLSPRSDVASAEQVRAAREARGWTVEQMADAVGAAPLEVSAWEAGAVAAPPLQAARVQWMLATDQWNAKTGGIRTSSGEPPPEPDESTFHTWRARYYRWVDRLPRPFAVLADLPEVAFGAAFALFRPEPGLPSRIAALGLGTLFWIAGLRTLRAMRTERPPLFRFRAGFLAGAVGSGACMVYWRHFDPAAQLGDSRLWAAGLVLSVATGVWVSRRKEAAEASAAQPAPALASSAAPHPLPGTYIPGIDETPPLHADPFPVVGVRANGAGTHQTRRAQLFDRTSSDRPAMHSAEPRALREAAGGTQEQAADAMGVMPAVVAARGKPAPWRAPPPDLEGA